MTAKQFLSRAFYAEKRIESREEEIARIRARLTNATRRLDDMPRGGNADWSDAVLRLTELEEKLAADICELCGIREAVAAAIAEVEDDRYRTVLEMRYLNYYGFEKIARKLHYNYDHTRRLHRMALRVVKVEKSAGGC